MRPYPAVRDGAAGFRAAVGAARITIAAALLVTAVATASAPALAAAKLR